MQIFEVSDLKCKPSTRIWYTLKAGSHYSSKGSEMGKIESRRMTVGEESGFNSQHVMLVDTSVAQTLILSLKTSSLLRTTLPLGRATFLLTDEGGSAGLTTHATTALKDRHGVVTARVRILLRVAPTPFPALLLTPNDSASASDLHHLTGAVTVTRPYRSPARDGQPGYPSHFVTLARAQSSALSLTVLHGPTVAVTAAQRKDRWDITERDDESPRRVARRFVLECRTGPPDLGHPMAFSLHQTTIGGHCLCRSALSLVPCNIFDPPDLGSSAPWGVWTLVRGRGPTVGAPAAHGTPDLDHPRHEVRASDCVALIHLAGPCVACRAQPDVSLALAVATAMFCTSVQRDEGGVCTQQLLDQVALCPTTMARTEQGVATWGRGFMVLPDLPRAGGGAGGGRGDGDVEAGRLASEWLERRMGANAEGRALHHHHRHLRAFVHCETPPEAIPPKE